MLNAVILMPLGTYTPTLKVKNEAGAVSNIVTGSPIVVSAFPTATTEVTVNCPNNVGDIVDLQSKITNAVGRTDIILPDGCVFNFTNSGIVIPVRTGDNNYVVIRSASAGSFGQGTRVSRDNSADLAKMATITTTALGNATLIKAAKNRHHYRFEGIYFKRLIGYSDVYTHLIDITPTKNDPNDPNEQFFLSEVPHHFIFNHCLFENAEGAGTRRAIALNSRDSSVLNSAFYNFRGNAGDSQAIGVWTTPGRHAIVNNYLEGGSENLLYGGSTMDFRYVTPSDITIRGNYLFKPLAWRETDGEGDYFRLSGNAINGTVPRGLARYDVINSQSKRLRVWVSSVALPNQTPLSVEINNQPVGSFQLGMNGEGTFDLTQNLPTVASGSTVTVKNGTTVILSGIRIEKTDKPNVKNSFELKHAKNVIFDGNVLENNWTGADQAGFIIVLTVRNQNADNSWTTIKNVQITNNKAINSPAGTNFLAIDDGGRESVASSDFIIRNNLFDRLGEPDNRATGNPITPTRLFQLVTPPRNLKINYNTFIRTPIPIEGEEEGKAIETQNILWTNNSGFVFTNNILKLNRYGFFASGGTSGQDVLNTFVAGWKMTNNVMFFREGDCNENYTLANYPVNNKYCSEFGSQGFNAQFVNFNGGNNGNYTLAPNSLGNDYPVGTGNVVGVNFANIQTFAGRATSGTWYLIP